MEDYQKHKKYPNIQAVEGNVKLMQDLEIELYSIDNFRYEVTTLSRNELVGYKIVAYLTSKGQQVFRLDLSDRLLRCDYAELVLQQPPDIHVFEAHLG